MAAQTAKKRIRGVRALAAGVLADVLGGHAVNGPLGAARASLPLPADRALLSNLCLGSLRHLFSNRALARSMLQKPGQKLPPRVEALLIVGLQQLRHTRIPPHAAVAETVAAARELGLPKATGLINALLRRYTRERDALDAGLQADIEAQWDHPAWFIDALREAWPDDWQQILAANNRPAPLWLRVNAHRQTRDAYAARLAEAGDWQVTPGRHAPLALRLEPAPAVAQLPGFADGDVAIQDQSAQLAAAILAPAPGERILDACAAPGGKTAHLAETCTDLDLVAADVCAERLARLTDNLARQGHHASTVVADLSVAGALGAVAPFDKILLDAPCTGSGVIRRHPDIKVLRRASDSAKLAALQGQLLRSVWHTLKPGGVLVYATCSVLPTENDAVIEAFLRDTRDACAEAIDAPGEWGRPTRHGRQVFPGEDASDGFYYAYIVKHP